MMMYIIIGIACLVGIIVVVLLLPNSGKQQQKDRNTVLNCRPRIARLCFLPW